MALPLKRAIELAPAAEKAFAELALMCEPEELCAELKSYVEELSWGACIRHPLVYSVFYNPIENRRLNAMLKLKREAIASAMAERNYETVVWLHERPYRAHAMFEIARHLPNRRYWALLGALWTDAENMHQSYDDWRALLQGRGGTPADMMSKPQDRAMWRKLRRQRSHIVFRGWAGETGKDGFSWTLSSETAHWFARRFANDDQPPHVATGLVDGRNVIAYFNDRGENEVVVLPEHVLSVGKRTAL